MPRNMLALFFESSPKKTAAKMADTLSEKVRTVLQSGKPYYWAALFESRGPGPRFVPVPLIESAAEYRTRDDVHMDYWLSRRQTMGGVMDTNAGMKVIGDAFVVYYFPHMQWQSRTRNMALKSIGLYGEEDLLIMKLDRRVEEGSVEIGHLFTGDLIEATKELIHNQSELKVARLFCEWNKGSRSGKKTVTTMDDRYKALDCIVQSFYRGTRKAVARLVYENEVYVHEANATTSVYYDSTENTVYQGVLLGQLHFGMCVMGDILFPSMHNDHWLRLGPILRHSSGEILFDAQVNALKGLFLRDQNKVGLSLSVSSRGWIFDGGDCKQYLMLYADPRVVRVHAPGYRFADVTDDMSSSIQMAMTEEMLSESADFPVRVVVNLKKHLSA
ncbi:hypothetical protein ARMGADRAFT_1030727 [Armillaria gallica]|uniref:Uncharacterized protein n=1 Tax=Armillaria gallica TaxID=47427 RepID=A0A2H3DLR6_ARMGA|nr:hypothetical protein ARMGADRAFT_1030727 [Armillaria gallica]